MNNKNKNQKSESRRAFVQKTAMATGVLLTVPIGVDGMARVNGNQKLKLALVGCGGRGSGAAVQALIADENVELVAMADAFSDRIERSLKGIKDYYDGEKKSKEISNNHKVCGKQNCHFKQNRHKGRHI